MKVLKGFFLVIIVILMFSVLALLQVQFALQRTVLSPDYFEKIYDENDMEEELAGIIEDQMEELTRNMMTEAAGREVEMTINPEDYIDAQWISEEISDTLQKTYRYFIGSTDKLPAIDLEPIKEMMLDMGSDQMLEYGNVSEILKSIDLILEAYNFFARGTEAELDEEVIAQIAAQNAEMGLSTEILETIILTSINLDDDLTLDERAKIIAGEIVSLQMGLDEMSDELDLNDIMEDAYPEGENPLEAARTIINVFKTTLFYGLLIIFLLFVLVVVFTAFKPARIFGWLSAPLIMGGLFGVGIWILGWVLPTIGGLAEAFQGEAFAGVENVMAFAEGYLTGIMNFFLIQGAIILAVGIVFAILAGVLSSRTGNRASEQPRTNAGLMAVRVIVVVVLLVSVVFVAARYYLKMYDEINDAFQVLENTQANETIVDFITESAGFPFADFMNGE